jgi:hypothetical protein
MRVPYRYGALVSAEMDKPLLPVVDGTIRLWTRDGRLLDTWQVIGTN